jgi:2-polyprenyl-3-methyl-5-hydroxy-6-metoxy-1,4-benzoquinol methylase
MSPPTSSAAARWAEALDAWAIPQEILDAAPESPWGFPSGLFERRHEELGPVDTPSYHRALEALSAGGSVLDVGVGGGAASLPLVPTAATITGVDQGAAMLESFARAARDVGVEHSVIEGSWPEIASRAPRADVVVCHHVFYNVPDLPPFAIALGEHARHRVVAELTERHPLVSLNDLWQHFHRTPRPDGPGAQDAHAVLAEAGIDAHIVAFDRPPKRHRLERPDLVAFVRRRLCLSPDADPEIDELLGDRESVTTGRAVTLWWDT